MAFLVEPNNVNNRIVRLIAEQVPIFISHASSVFGFEKS